MESKCQLGCYLFIYLIYPSHPFLTRQHPLRFLFIVSVRVEKALPALSFSVSLSAHLPIFLFILSHDLCTLHLLWWNYLINSVFSIDYMGHVEKDSEKKKSETWNLQCLYVCVFVLSRFPWGQQMIDSCIGKTIHDSKSEWVWWRQRGFRVTFLSAQERTRETKSSGFSVLTEPQSDILNDIHKWRSTAAESIQQMTKTMRRGKEHTRLY